MKMKYEGSGLCPASIQSRNALNKKGFSSEEEPLWEKEPLFATSKTTLIYSGLLD